MVLYLRTKKNETLLDVELYVKTEDGHRFVELRSVVPIGAYSKYLLDNPSRQDEIIETFSQLDELRGWLWENYFMGRQNNPDEYDSVVKEVTKIFKDVANKFDLSFITD